MSLNLYRLPNGIWIDPALVSAVVPHRDGTGCRVFLREERAIDVLKEGDDETGEEFTDRIVREMIEAMKPRLTIGPPLGM